MKHFHGNGDITALHNLWYHDEWIKWHSRKLKLDSIFKFNFDSTILGHFLYSLFSCKFEAAFNYQILGHFLAYIKIWGMQSGCQWHVSCIFNPVETNSMQWTLWIFCNPNHHMCGSHCKSMVSVMIISKTAKYQDATRFFNHYSHCNDMKFV